MKAKKFKRILLSLIGITFLSLVNNQAEPITVNAEETQDEVVHAYYKSQYSYAEVPNTFTATFKLNPLQEGETGVTNVLFSSYASSTSSTTVGYTSIQINEDGHVRFNWNNAEVIVVFTSKDYRTGNWEHIAVVRDEATQAFYLYDKGEFLEKQGTTVGTSNKGTYAPAIGNDLRSTATKLTPRYPFLGEIKDVAVYTKALTADELLVEYNITDKKSINKKINPYVLHNWVLEGEAISLIYKESMPEWVYDYSGNENHAYLATSFHWYDAPQEKWWEANEDEYTFVFYPDIQETVDFQRSKIYVQNEWVVEHAEEMNLTAVLTLGDLTNASLCHWSTTSDAFKVLQNADIPHVLILGNHDYDDQTLTSAGGRESGHFNENFKYEDYASKEWFVEAKEVGKLDNACYKFSALGVNYLVFALEFGPADSTMEWASSILDRPEYADYRAIILSHNILGRSGYFTDETNGPTKYGFTATEDVNNGIDIWEKLLRKHDNVFISAGGHVAVDSIMRKFDTGDHGNQILSMLINGQSVVDYNGKRGASLIAICKFNEKTKTMKVNYYDAINDKYFCVENQFEYDYSNWNSKNIISSEGIITDDYKAPGETVEFMVNTKSDSTKSALVVTDERGNNIPYTKNGTTYSLTMPETALNIELVEINENQITLPSQIEMSIEDTLDLSTYLPIRNDYQYTLSESYEVKDNVLTPKLAGQYSLSVSLKGIGKIAETSLTINPHVCNFENKVIEEKYLASSATCSDAAKYYYSCDCGNYGDATFVEGKANSHVFDQKVVEEKYLAQEATCISLARYYYSCKCGEKSNVTFTNGDVTAHKYNTESNCHDKECYECHQVTKASQSHNFGEGVVVEEATTEKEGKKEYICLDCGAKLTEIIAKLPSTDNNNAKVVSNRKKASNIVLYIAFPPILIILAIKHLFNI